MKVSEIFGSNLLTIVAVRRGSIGPTNEPVLVLSISGTDKRLVIASKTAKNMAVFLGDNTDQWHGKSFVPFSDPVWIDEPAAPVTP